MKFEFTFLDWLQSKRTPFWDKIMVGISTAGNGGAVWILLAAVFLLLPGYRKCGLMMLAVLLAGAVICNLFLKVLINRARPFEVRQPSFPLLISPPKDRSFPSGHTMSSFAGATVIFLYDYRLGIIAFVFAALMGVSRMYLYVHFPSDIIGGVIAGIAVACAVTYMICSYSEPCGIGKIQMECLYSSMHF